MDDLIQLDSVSTHSGEPDDLFVCFAKNEEKCLGAAGRLFDYKSEEAVVFSYTDRNVAALDYETKLQDLLQPRGEPRIVRTPFGDPLGMVRRLRAELLGVADVAVSQRRSPRITFDTTSFSKNELLLALRLLDDLNLLKFTRLLYTEPDDYEVVESSIWTSPGIREVSIVPTFKGLYDSQRALVLVLFLGYEGDRALATWEIVEPNATYVVIPKPAFHPTWEGKTERHNAAILAALDPDENIRYAHSREPRSTYELMDQLVREWPDEEVNWYVSHLGTKLQMIGLYYFLARHRDDVSVIDSKPYGGHVEYKSIGIGQTWEVPGPPTLEPEV